MAIRGGQFEGQRLPVAWVSGLDYSLERGTSSKNSAVVVPALQSRPTALFFGARPSWSTLNFPVHLQRHRHRFDRSGRVVAHSVLNGLHHEYGLLARAGWRSLNFCGRHSFDFGKHPIRSSGRILRAYWQRNQTAKCWGCAHLPKGPLGNLIVTKSLNCRMTLPKIRFEPEAGKPVIQGTKVAVLNALVGEWFAEAAL